MIIEDDDLYGKACGAYERYCERRGWIYYQPSRSLSDMDDQYIYLRNSNGDLARYGIASGRIRTTGKLTPSESV